MIIIIDLNIHQGGALLTAIHFSSIIKYKCKLRSLPKKQCFPLSALEYDMTQIESALMDNEYKNIFDMQLQLFLTYFTVAANRELEIYFPIIQISIIYFQQEWFEKQATFLSTRTSGLPRENWIKICVSISLW